MQKFYVVPAEVIESNFPDDLDSLLPSVAVIETQMTITEIAEILLKVE